MLRATRPGHAVLSARLKRKRAALTICSCALALGCDQPDAGIVAPMTSSSGINLWLSNAGAARASGFVDIHGTELQNVRDETYSFVVVSTGTGILARGHVEARLLLFTGEAISVRADVTCAAVVGNEAWVGGQVTQFVFDGEELPGERRVIFRVQDHGRGDGTMDFASLLFFGAPPGGDLAYCQTRPTFPILFGSLRGNIEVLSN